MPATGGIIVLAIIVASSAGAASIYVATSQSASSSTAYPPSFLPGSSGPSLQITTAAQTPYAPPSTASSHHTGAQIVSAIRQDAAEGVLGEHVATILRHHSRK